MPNSIKAGQYLVNDIPDNGVGYGAISGEELTREKWRERREKTPRRAGESGMEHGWRMLIEACKRVIAEGRVETMARRATEEEVHAFLLVCNGT